MVSKQYQAAGLLRPGDRVRIIAPSGPVSTKRFEAGIRCLEEWQLQPVYEETMLSAEGYLAGNNARRLAELHTAMADTSCKAIWCARGGYGATRLLPQIDLSGTHNLIGFSDATALHALWQGVGRQSVHACNVTGLAEWDDSDRQALYQGLFHGAWPSLKGQTACGQQSVQGPVLGGNLTVLAAMAGTGFLPDLRGAIVLLEDVAERPYRLDRSLTQLLQSGAFEGAVGFVIGQLISCEDPPGKTLGLSALEAILSILEPLQVPILTGVEVGHARTSLPVALGARMRLDPVAGVLRTVHE